MKGCELAINGATLLGVEVKALRHANQKQTRKRSLAKTFIGQESVLTGEEGQNRIKKLRTQEIESKQTELTRRESAPTRAPPRCSLCRALEHNARNCPTRYTST